MFLLRPVMFFFGDCTGHTLMYIILLLLFMLFFTLLAFSWAGWLSSIPFVRYITRCSYFFVLILPCYQPLAARHSSSQIWYQVISTLFVALFLCVSHQPTSWFLLCSKLATPSSVRPFFCPTVASNSYSSWDECPSNLWTSPTFSELANMTTIWPPLLLQQQLLRLNFVPTMRRNCTFGSASSRPSLQRQESYHKNSNMPTPSPACPSKSFGTFWIPSMSATTLPSRSIFKNKLCLVNLARASGNPILNYFAFPWKCRASSPVFSWENSNNISLQESPLTMIFFFKCFWSDSYHPWEKQ